MILTPCHPAEMLNTEQTIFANNRSNKRIKNSSNNNNNNNNDNDNDNNDNDNNNNIPCWTANQI